MSLKKIANKKKRKNTAMVIYGHGKDFWITQAQIWQWSEKAWLPRPVIRP